MVRLSVVSLMVATSMTVEQWVVVSLKEEARDNASVANGESQ